MSGSRRPVMSAVIFSEWNIFRVKYFPGGIFFWWNIFRVKYFPSTGQKSGSSLCLVPGEIFSRWNIFRVEYFPGYFPGGIFSWWNIFLVEYFPGGIFSGLNIFLAPARYPVHPYVWFRKACDECGKTFISNIVLNKHKKHVHRSDTEFKIR